MKTVDVSVLITNYNHGRFLFECLDAVFSQTVQPIEVIVIDDASTDNSIILIHEYMKKQPRLTLLQNHKNLGPAKTMNKAIHHAKGTYIILAAADDKLLPGSLEKGALYLDQYPEVGICCSNPTFFQSNEPGTQWKTLISKQNQPTPIFKDEIINAYLHNLLWIPTHASMYRREFVLQYGCLDDGLKHICDWYLNCKIALNHGVIFVPDSFGAFRVSTQSYGAVWNRSYKKKLALYKQLFSMLSVEDKTLKQSFRRSGVIGLISSDVLLYLLCSPSLWAYFPRAFYRKTRNLIRKILNRPQIERLAK